MRNKIHRARRREFCEETGKFKYLTREDAASGMFHLAATEPKSALNLSAYRCQHCEEFHVGHMPKQVRERFAFD